MSAPSFIKLDELGVDLCLTTESMYQLRRRHGWKWLTTTAPDGRRSRSYWIDPAGAAQWFQPRRPHLAARIAAVAASLDGKEAGR